MGEKRSGVDRDDDVKVGENKIRRIEKETKQVIVEVRAENERFSRVSELLEEWYEKGKILIFVKSDERCDALSGDLVKHGYRCLSLHDHDNVECTISDFKTSIPNSVLVATSVAARSMDDVKEVQLVILFDLPTRFLDYVHHLRIERTGSKGCTVTFLSVDEDAYAPNLVLDLEEANQAVPDDLMALVKVFVTKYDEMVYSPEYTRIGSGRYGINCNNQEEKEKAQTNWYSQSISTGSNIPRFYDNPLPEMYEADLEINDFPIAATRKVTHKNTVLPIIESTGVRITTLGAYIEPGKTPPPLVRKAYMSIIGPNKLSVERAKAELKRVLEEHTTTTTTTQATSLPT